MRVRSLAVLAVLALAWIAGTGYVLAHSSIL